MNDQTLLNFIMELNDVEFDEWATGARDDEIQYAIEILAQFRKKLAKQEQDIMNALEVSTFKEANSVLKKFMLNSNN